MPEKFQLLSIDIKMNVVGYSKCLDKQLSKQDWITGDYSIADIANWCWVRTYKWSGVNVEGLDNLMSWSKRMYEQPGMLKGIEVPFKVENLLKKKMQRNL